MPSWRQAPASESPASGKTYLTHKILISISNILICFESAVVFFALRIFWNPAKAGACNA